MGYSIYDNKMTIFYSLHTGKVKCYCGGVQTMSYFGDEAEDFNYGTLVVEKDQWVMNNYHKFIVEDDRLIYRTEEEIVPTQYLR